MQRGEQVSEWAKAHIGDGYSQEQRMEPNLHDCSSFAKKAWLFVNSQLEMPDSTCDYPGDLITLDNVVKGCILWRLGHVGIFVGDNIVVHADGPEKGIVAVPL